MEQSKNLAVKSFLRRIDRKRGVRYGSIAESVIINAELLVLAIFNRFKMSPLSFYNSVYKLNWLKLYYSFPVKPRTVDVVVTHDSVQVSSSCRIYPPVELISDNSIEQILFQIANNVTMR